MIHDCRQARPRLDDLLDGYLDEHHTALVCAHLALCPRCARERDLLVALRDALRRLTIPVMSEGFADTALAAAASTAARAQRDEFGRSHAEEASPLVPQP